MHPKLSVAIITLNEEQNIRRTLESIRWADEIVVVDSGSTDATPAICREYTAHVIHQDWLGYSRQKNAAIDRTTGDWILSLDADEPIEPALADEIRAIMSSPTALDGYWIPRKTFFLGKQVRHGGWYPDYNLRLFRKGRARFGERAVHESLQLDGTAGLTKYAILHYAYPDLASYMSSINRYSTLGAVVMTEKGISRFKRGWVNLMLRPVATFVYRYFFRRGFLDGKHGLVLNLFHSYYVFAKYAKAWELHLGRMPEPHSLSDDTRRE
ncbi:MAG TPA: glycosyltransferase family 2 protein [Nitrospirota bacterium]|nr:glycosyltransferase family 2 protein [Nitrospirota bacterium]